LSSGVWTCWYCGRHRPAETLSLLSGRDVRECIDLLGDTERRRKALERIARGRVKPPPDVGPLQSAHRDYLASRGFDPDEIAAVWGVRGIGLGGGRLAWHLFIPITVGGETLSWTTRSINPKQSRRYHGAAPDEEAWPAKKLLYGEDLAAHAVAVVEGPASAWAFGPGAVATLGTGYTPTQVARVARFPVRVVCFDAEPAAQRRADALCRQLECFPGSTKRAVLETGKDPAEARSSEVRRLRETVLQ
jgi:hypothetical protein